jgi:hypothetical protein
MELVMELTGCGMKQAAEALAKHKEIWLAVDSLLTKPPVSGDKYMPEKPVVDTGMDSEQKERCAKGRWMQDKINEVFSVAHSQTRTQPDAEAHAALPALGDSPAATASEKAPVSSQPLGSDEKTSLPVPQSARLQ